MSKIEFTPNEDLQTLNKIFTDAGFQLRVVGGAVRDMIQGQEPKDIDLCTDATPVEMQAMSVQVQSAGGYIIETGLQHGTLTFVFNSIGYEITTLRIDTDTYGRHAEVEYTHSFEKDSSRRDFTCNQLLMDFNGNIFDYHNGIEDIQNGVIRFVGNAEERIQEDYLRILRYFRFAGKIDNSWQNMNDNDKTIVAIRKHMGGLKQISKERIWQEMSKLFVAPFGARIVSIMEHIGINEVIGLPPMSAFSWNKRDITAIVASFFQNEPEKCRVFCRSWKMSNEITDKASFIAGHTTILNKNTIQDLLVKGTPRDWVVDAINISFLRTFAEMWVAPVFPVTGQDLIDRGFVQGKAMGQKLTALKSRWIDSRFNLTKEELLND